MKDSMKDLFRKLTDREVIKGVFFGIFLTGLILGFYILFALLEGGVCD